MEAPEKFLRLVPREMGFLWRSSGYVQLAGGGCTAKISATGPDRFTRLRERTRQFWKTVVVRAPPGIRPFAPVLFGGAAFAADVPPIEPWDEFVEDVFTLPRFGYRRTGTEAYVTVAIPAAELAGPGAVDRIQNEIAELMRQLEYESPTSMIERVELGRGSIHHMPAPDWAVYIDAIQSAIASGRFDKIVAARRSVVDLSRPLEDTGFMARLFAAYPDCTHFALRRERSTFLGATPETLFRKQGEQLTTHALAGTTRIKDDPNEDSSRDVAALRSSNKDLSEHALVVKKICEDLWSLSKRIRYSSSPTTRHVRNLVHLQTPISAELRPDVHVFDLLASFHPTPAVGGFPAKEAADWLRRNEPGERGWYTGVVGWCDANDDAEFAVAIRCGVLTERRAYVFAGAGIVRQSNAESEYLETAAKMAPLLRALGVMK
jgi:isochorismate synthase